MDSVSALITWWIKIATGEEETLFSKSDEKSVKCENDSGKMAYVASLFNHCSATNGVTSSCRQCWCWPSSLSQPHFGLVLLVQVFPPFRLSVLFEKY